MSHLLLCFTLLSGLLTSQFAAADQQEELDTLRRRIQSLQQEIEKTSESRSDAADALRESERAISNSSRKLNELAQQSKQARLAFELAQQQSFLLAGELRNQNRALGQLFYQQYLGGQQTHLKLLLNNRNPNQVARELHYYQYIARQRALWLGRIKTSLRELETASAETARRSAELIALQTEAQVQRKSLENEKRTRQQVLTKLSRQLSLQRREVGRLQRDEARLSQLVEKLARMLSQPRKRGLLRNDQLPDSRFDGKPFAALKGKLIFPVKGEITNDYGSNRPDSTVQWKGLFLRAASDQPVKAVAAGRVVYADWLRGFGNLLIIDHGNGYMSLYGNNETLFKQVGDSLRGGDTIATVGNSGGNEESGLYFELRHEGKPFDPIKWVAR